MPDVGLETVELAKSGVADASIAGTRRESKVGEGNISVAGLESDESLYAKQERYEDTPTEEELHGPNALRRVSGKIPWTAWTITFVELCERFSYYGKQLSHRFALHPLISQQVLLLSMSTSSRSRSQRVPGPVPGFLASLVPSVEVSKRPQVLFSSTSSGHT